MTALRLAVGPLMQQGGGGGEVHPSDSFNRSNGALGVADNGSSWVETPSSAIVVSSNVATLTTGLSASSQYIATLPFASGNGTVKGDMGVTSATLSGLVFRFTNTNNFLRVVYQSNFSGGSMFLEKWDSASYSLITHTTGLGLSSPFKLEAVLSGSSISIEANDVEVLSASDSFNASETNHGILIGTLTGQSTSAATIDDFDFTAS